MQEHKHNKANQNHVYNNTWYVIKRLYNCYLTNYLRTLVFAITFMVIVAITNVTIVNMVQPAIDLVFINKQNNALYLWSIAAILIYCIKGVAEFYQNFLVEYIGQKIIVDLQMDLYKHLLYADIELIDKHTSARLISRFTNDIAIIRKAIIDFFVGTAKHILYIFFLIILMFKTEFKLSCVAFFAFPLLLYIISFISKKLKAIASSIQEEMANYTLKLDETFQYIKVVKSFLGEELEFERANKKVVNLLALYKKSIKYCALIAPITEIVNGIAVCGIVLYGGILVINGKSTPGAIFTFIAAFLAAYRPFKSVMSLNASLQDGIIASSRLFYLLDTEPSVEKLRGLRLLNSNNPTIVFDKITSVSDRGPILNNISFTIKANSTVAIVGSSGSGKTSIINLLLYFKEKQYGSILIDDIPIEDISIKSLRENIALVSQETMLFDGSILDNIKYGNPDANMQEVIDASIESQAYDFINILPEKFNTIITSKASSLSGGQKQRIAIARALLKKASILLLDEAASGLDVNAEIAIYKTLQQRYNDKTIIIITHRLNTITQVDNIIVLKDGVVAEQGRHEDLLNNKSQYYSLYTSYLKNID